MMTSNDPRTIGGATGDLSKEGSAWVTARIKERETTNAILSDPKYKKYSQQVEKCLNTFENMQEWPDFIAFLKQLHKTLQSYTQFKEIPKKLIVAKRLSQCLNPALPSGVHQRALDTYSHILAVLGSDGLRRDLQLWSSGLFPFFEYASTSVKPTLLNLFETHYLPLQEHLRHVMKSFILALLPGLEEETGEFFEKVMSLLDQLSGTVSPAFFLQNVWLVMLTSQVPRAYAINYLSRRLPRLDAEEDITPIVGRDIGLMIRAFASALEDDNLLVRRGALDLLTQSLRLDGGAIKRASAEDRAILTRAATSVVLRRDLSLNRRLYTWLLGRDENSEKQMLYFRTYAMELVRSTLQSEMFNPSAEYPDSRPFKIFISLLDKWEIGSLLTDVLIYDALTAIKKSLQGKGDNADDLLITATTLYEAVEPHAIWKQLFEAVRQDITTKDSHKGAIDMLLFVIKTFRLQEEEVQDIHLPLVFSAISEILANVMRSDPSRSSDPATHSGMQLLEEMLRHIPMSSLTKLLKISDVPIPQGSGFDYMACKFYGIEKDKVAVPEKSDFSSIPFVSSFQHLIDYNCICVNSLRTHAPNRAEKDPADKKTWTGFAQSMLLVANLLALADQSPTVNLVTAWDPQNWLENVLCCLTLPDCPFVAVDRVVTAIVHFSRTKAIQPVPVIDDRPTLIPIMRSLLSYLRPERSIYHFRVVTLIWALECVTEQRHLESIVAQSLTSSQLWNAHESYENFGVLWRLTDDTLQPGFRFKIPLLIILDSLGSDDPNLRRIGETWMRCSLKSYTRVLDPIIFELLDPSIRQTQDVVTVRGREIRGLTYSLPFDQRRIIYLLEILLHVVRFGGQGFSRVAASTALSRSSSNILVERVSIASAIGPEATYMDILVELLLRFLQSEPKSSLSQAMSSMNISMHSTVIDLLQAIISRGEIDVPTVETMEAVVISKLFISVHSSRLEIQNKLLHLLHSIISASAVSSMSQHNRIDGYGQLVSNSLQSDHLVSQPPSEASLPSAKPFLIQTLVDGIVVATNRPLLQHWLDFVMMTVSQFPQTMTSAILPLSGCVCRQLSRALAEVKDILLNNEKTRGDIVSSVDDAEIIALLNALERLILFSLPEAADLGISDEGMSDKGGPDGTGLFNYVSNVFNPDIPSNVTEEQLTARSLGFRSLHEGVGVLYTICVLVSQVPVIVGPELETLTHLFSRTRFRSRKVLERLFRAQSLEVVESIVDHWYKNSQGSEPNDCAFEIVDFLTSSSQNVVHLICECILSRISASTDKSRKPLNVHLTDAVLFNFLEGYLGKLEGPLVAQVWNRYYSLAKEIASNAREYRLQVFPALKCLTVVAHKITQTTAIEDRRVRKDLQEIFGKLLDACVLIAGRSFDQGNWIRRSNKDSLAVNGRESPMPQNASETKPDEKIAEGSSSLTDASKSSSGIDLIDRIIHFLAKNVLPYLRLFLMENDKIAGACSNIVYHIVSPALRAKSSQSLDIEDVVLKIIEEMSRLPAAFKSWRSPVNDAFNDNRFFNLAPIVGHKWRPIIKALANTDKTALGELLGKIATAPSANIFTNREYEMLLRSLNLRRLSYIVFAAEKNHFLAQLPVIQEKLVDVLRNVNSPIVESEVYLCIRALLCRLSPHNLSSFWPVLLTELYRIFEQAMTDPPSDGSEDLHAILSACKLLDLLLVLQTEEFQIHQWIFITDTVDAIYRPDNTLPEAMMDQLAEVVSNLPATETKTTPDIALDRPSPYIMSDITNIGSSSNRSMRRPLLRTLKQIDSIRDLAPFFSHVSILSYESVYSSGGVIDWEAVEEGLVEDMFEGR